MNEVTITREEMRDKISEAIAKARDFLVDTNIEDEKEDIIFATGVIGSLIGAILLSKVFGEGEEE